MRILNCLLCFCILLSTSCSKAANPAVEFFNKAEVAYYEKNYKEAIEWCKKSAELGNPMAIALLGSMYYLGQGTLKDYKEAFKWVKKSAELGNTKAMNLLGGMYYSGQGTLKDPQQAKYWIKKAYNAGDKDAEETWNTLELWKY